VVDFLLLKLHIALHDLKGRQIVVNVPLPQLALAHHRLLRNLHVHPLPARQHHAALDEALRHLLPARVGACRGLLEARAVGERAAEALLQHALALGRRRRGLHRAREAGHGAGLALHEGGGSLGNEGLHLGMGHEELDEVRRVDHGELATLHETKRDAKLVPIICGTNFSIIKS